MLSQGMLNDLPEAYPDKTVSNNRLLVDRLQIPSSSRLGERERHERPGPDKYGHMPMLFDMNRMTYGGFSTIVEA